MKTIDGMIEESCLKFADKTAVRCKIGGQWQNTSYRQLWQAVSQVAAGLQAWGMHPGDRIALLGGNSPQWISCYLGILHGGGIVVPVDKELKGGEMRHVLADCQARLLFSEPPYLDLVADIAGDLPYLKMVVLFDEPSTLSPQGELLQEKMLDLTREWRRLAAQFDIPEEEMRPLEVCGRELQQLLGTASSAQRAHRQKPDGITCRIPAAGLYTRLAQRFRNNRAPPPHPAKAGGYSGAALHLRNHRAIQRSHA
ncbi:MAG: AMP-binding protein [Syntrophotaleaceae bacterium]